MKWPDLRGRFAPDGHFAVCPHCWEVNIAASQLCGRCGADMRLALQESGGLRATAPVQSPVPVRVGERLSPGQRFAVLVFVLLLFVGQVLGALQAHTWPWFAPRGTAAASLTGADSPK